MSELANKAAQEAYVNSLYRMTQEQLIAEVMRVQMDASELIKAEVELEREACAEIADSKVMDTSILTSLPAKSAAAFYIAEAIRARSKKVITQ